LDDVVSLNLIFLFKNMVIVGENKKPRKQKLSGNKKFIVGYELFH